MRKSKIERDAITDKYFHGKHTVNLPEWGLVEEMAISEAVKRKKALQPGTLLREMVSEVHKAWKRKGRLPWSTEASERVMGK